MAMKFRRSKKIAPGVKINLNKKSASVTIGGKYGRITMGTSGKVTRSASIPGTGIYFSESSGGSGDQSNQKKKSKLSIMFTVFSATIGLVFLAAAVFGKIGIMWTIGCVAIGAVSLIAAYKAACAADLI